MEQTKRAASSITAPRPNGLRQQLFPNTKRVRFEVNVNDYVKDLVKEVEQLHQKQQAQSADLQKIVSERTTKVLDDLIQKKGNPFLKEYSDGKGGFDNPTRAMSSKKVHNAIKR